MKTITKLALALMSALLIAGTGSASVTAPFNIPAGVSTIHEIYKPGETMGGIKYTDATWYMNDSLGLVVDQVSLCVYSVRVNAPTLASFKSTLDLATSGEMVTTRTISGQPGYVGEVSVPTVIGKMTGYVAEYAPNSFEQVTVTTHSIDDLNTILDSIHVQ